MMEDRGIKGLSFLAVRNPDGTHNYLIDDHHNHYYMVKTADTLENYPPINWLDRKDIPFVVFLGTQDSDRKILSNGVHFDPDKVGRTTSQEYFGRPGNQATQN